MNLSAIIFCYNEEGSIVNVFKQVHDVLKTVSNDFEVIFVNDGSSDRTKLFCELIEKEHTFVHLINHESNLGIGMAIKSGYFAATKEYVCAIPGDGQFDVREIANIRPFNFKTYYSFYRVQTNYATYRKALTWFNRLFNQHILGVYLRDVNWVKVYRMEQLHVVNIELSSSLIESEICAKLYKHKILPIEVPSIYLTRKSGVSSGGDWKTLKKAIVELLFLYWVVIKYNPKRKEQVNK